MIRPARARTRFSRRKFLQGVAGVSALAGAAELMAACQAPRLPAVAPGREMPVAASSPAPAGTTVVSSLAGNGSGRVAFVKTEDRAAGVREALRLLDPAGFAGKHVLLKPNYNSADPAPGSTHPDVLRTLVEDLWARQAGSITLADRSGMGNTRTVMKQLGVFALAEELGVETTVLDEVDAKGWELIRLPQSHWQQGFPFARCCLEAGVVVQACCLKTHRFGGHFTLSLKNSVGLVAKYRPGESYNYMQELHGSPLQRTLIAEINAAYSPALIVMDGVEAFVNGGPDTGERVAANVVLAGTDRVAVDAVGVAILRHFGTTPAVSSGPIFAQEQLARAVELGLGVDSPEKIELVTDDVASAAYAAEIQAVLRA